LLTVVCEYVHRAATHDSHSLTHNAHKPLHKNTSGMRPRATPRVPRRAWFHTPAHPRGLAADPLTATPPTPGMPLPLPRLTTRFTSPSQHVHVQLDCSAQLPSPICARRCTTHGITADYRAHGCQQAGPCGRHVAVFDHPRAMPRGMCPPPPHATLSIRRCHKADRPPASPRSWRSRASE